jgi:hypothetical protein
VVQCVWGCQDDNGATRPLNPPLPHRRDRQWVLPVSAQHEEG